MAAAPFAVRAAAERDADGIARTLAAAFAGFAHQYTPAALAATVPGPDAIRARMREARAWVAELGGAIVGRVAARAPATGVCVQSMAVDPAARRGGVGRGLMQQAVRFAQEVEAPRLYLSTTPFLDGAIRLYLSLGFAFVDEGPHDLHGTPLRTMELRR